MTTVDGPASQHILESAERYSAPQGASAFENVESVAGVRNHPKPENVIIRLHSRHHTERGFENEDISNPFVELFYKDLANSNSDCYECGAPQYSYDDLSVQEAACLSQSDAEYEFIEDQVYQHLVTNGSIGTLIISGHGTGSGGLTSAHYGDEVLLRPALQAVERGLRRAQTECPEVTIEDGVHILGCSTFKFLDEDKNIAFAREFSVRTGLELKGEIEDTRVVSGGGRNGFGAVNAQHSVRYHTVVFKDGIPYVDLRPFSSDSSTLSYGPETGQIDGISYAWGDTEVIYRVPEYALDIVNTPNFDPDDLASYQEAVLDVMAQDHGRYGFWLQDHAGVTAAQAEINAQTHSRLFQSGGTFHPDAMWSDR